MRKQIIMGLGLALAIAGTAAAQQGETKRPERAGEQRGPGMRGRGGPDGLLLKGIELSEGQRAQIAQLQKSQRDSMQSKRGENRSKMDEMRVARERGDTAAVRADMAKNRQAMQQDRAQHIAAIRNVLTAEQRVQFDKNVAELQAGQAERGQRGPAMRGDSGHKHPQRAGKSVRGRR